MKLLSGNSVSGAAYAQQIVAVVRLGAAFQGRVQSFEPTYCRLIRGGN